MGEWELEMEEEEKEEVKVKEGKWTKIEEGTRRAFIYVS